MKYVSVCSGMEAASVAWHDLGFTPLAFAEIDAFPSAILKHRFPNTPNYGDLTKYKEWPIEPGSVDLLVGGTPCQAFSVAGLRKGLADPRGNLSLTFLGLVQHLRPRWVLWENVPGVLSSGKPAGSDFASFLAGLGELGYGWAYRICDAQFYGVPQRRRRIFVVASSTGDWRVAAETLSLAEGMRGYLEASDSKRKGTARRAKGSVGADGLDGTVGTLCADSHPGAYSGQDAYTGRLIPQATPVVIDRAAFNQGVNAKYDPHIEQTDVMDTVVARGPHAIGVPAQPLPIDFRNNKIFDDPNVTGTIQAKPNGGYSLNYTTGILQPIPIHDQATRHAGKRGDKQDGKGNGLGIGQPGDPMNTLTRGDHHAVAIPYRKAKRAQSDKDDETWVEAEASNTLNNFDLGDTRTTHAVVEQKVYENHPNDSRVTGPLDVAPTVVSRFGTGGGNVPFVNNEPVVSPTVTTCKGSRGGCSSEAIDEITAIHKAQGEPVAFDTYNQAVSPISKTLSCAASDADHVGTVFMPAMAVRRLSVRECERLQGFPDDWSMIPWKGKPAEQCPDGPRYKACGNSMAVPVMRHLGKAIAAMDSKIKGIS